VVTRLAAATRGCHCTRLSLTLMKTEFFEGLIATSDRIPKNLAFLGEIKPIKVER
jgi:hypothetical protein